MFVLWTMSYSTYIYGCALVVAVHLACTVMSNVYVVWGTCTPQGLQPSRLSTVCVYWVASVVAKAITRLLIYFLQMYTLYKIYIIILYIPNWNQLNHYYVQFIWQKQLLSLYTCIIYTVKTGPTTEIYIFILLKQFYLLSNLEWLFAKVSEVFTSVVENMWSHTFILKNSCHKKTSRTDL